MDGELRLVNRGVDPTDPLAKLKAEVPEGQVVWAALSLGTFFVAVDKESTSPAGRDPQSLTK
jgi:hypothetical protein